MADGLSTANATAFLDALVDVAYVQLHTGDPGANGTANVSSVTTREASGGFSVSGAVATMVDEPEWTNWAGNNGEVITDISLWSASSSGTFGGSMQLASPVTMDTGDSLTLTSVTITIPTAS
jgi:hypothetical protein